MIILCPCNGSSAEMNTNIIYPPESFCMLLGVAAAQQWSRLVSAGRLGMSTAFGGTCSSKSLLLLPPLSHLVNCKIRKTAENTLHVHIYIQLHYVTLKEFTNHRSSSL